MILARYTDPALSMPSDGAATDCAGAGAGASRRLDRIATDLQFEYGPYGKPSLADGPFFSVSHTADHLAIVVCRSCSIGIDIEERRHLDDWQDIARLVLTREEQRSLAAGPTDATPDRSDSGSAHLLAAWTRKEAFLKALGLGVARHLHDVDVRLDPDCDDALSSTRLEGITANRWRVGSIDIDKLLIAALALESRGRPTFRCQTMTTLLECQGPVS